MRPSRAWVARWPWLMATSQPHTRQVGLQRPRFVVVVVVVVEVGG